MISAPSQIPSMHLRLTTEAMGDENIDVLVGERKLARRMR